MSQRLLLAIPLVLALVLGGFFYSALFSDPRELESVRIGQPLPEFELIELNTGEVFTRGKLPNQAFLLNVWATWCPTCAAEHAYLNQLAAQGIPIIGVNYKDDTLKAREWLVQLGDPYVATLEDQNGQFGLDLGVYGAPETYIVDAKGEIVYRHVGDVNERVWQNTLAVQFAQARLQ